LFAQNNIKNIPIDINIYAEQLAAQLSESKPTTMKQVIYNYCNALSQTSPA